MGEANGPYAGGQALGAGGDTVASRALGPTGQPLRKSPFLFVFSPFQFFPFLTLLEADLGNVVIG